MRWFSVFHNTPKSLKGLRNVCQVFLAIQINLGEMIKQTFDGRGEGISCRCFVGFANGHEEQGEQLKTPIQHAIHCQALDQQL